MEATSVTSKGQVTIPQKLRQQLGIRRGSRIEFRLVGDHVEAVSVLRHLLALGHVTVEDRTTVEHALSHCEAGVDLADAMHHASYRACASMASFDDQKFARRAKKLGLAPVLVIPA